MTFIPLTLCALFMDHKPLSMRGTVHTADTWQLQYSILSLEPEVAEIPPGLSFLSVCVNLIKHTFI